MKIKIDAVVFPSEENTISVISDDDESKVGYENPCHLYEVRNCLGFKDGKTEYKTENLEDPEDTQRIQFIQKNEDGTIIPGVQSEQLILIVKHRLETMNKLFPCSENEKQLAGLEMYLEGCYNRVKNRIDRGVMGNLQK